MRKLLLIVLLLAAFFVTGCDLVEDIFARDTVPPAPPPRAIATEAQVTGITWYPPTVSPVVKQRSPTYFTTLLPTIEKTKGTVVPYPTGTQVQCPNYPCP